MTPLLAIVVLIALFIWYAFGAGGLIDVDSRLWSAVYAAGCLLVAWLIAVNL